MATSGRDARRRKIVDRGSDRLALITGRIQNLPPSVSSPSESPLSRDGDSSQTVISHGQDLRFDKAPDSPNGENGAPASMLLDRDPITAFGLTGATGGGSSDEPLLHKFEQGINTLEPPAMEGSSNLQAPVVSSMDQGFSVLSSHKEQSVETQKREHISFKPNHIRPAQISAAIAASEQIRLFCSITVAFLVVLAHLGFPLLGSTVIKSTLCFKPLLLVLLTDLTIVLLRLLDNQRGSERTGRGENKAPSTDSDDYGWAEQVGKALEIGFVAKKVVDALFMDCSVYLVIVVCGLTFS